MRLALLRTALILLLATPAYAAAQGPLDSRTTYSRSQAQARAIGNVSVVLRPSQLSFDFGGGSRATLSPKGEWFVDARVHHNGLLCAQYSVGMRFGIGRPGCSNVAWLTDVTYVTSQNQCNNATVEHSGGDVQATLEGSFTQITCAERVTRCVGLCK